MHPYPFQAAIVTGASSGLGRAVALLLLQRGVKVALVGRNVSALQAIRNQFPEAQVVDTDLADPGQVEGLVERCQRKIGIPIDLLVNCAGFAVSGRLEDISADAQARSWQVNLASPIALCRQAIPHLLANRRGTILNVSSGVALRALPFLSPYCAAKAALNSATESLRLELRSTPIKICLFSPGPVESGFHSATEHYGSIPLHFTPSEGVAPEIIAQKLLRAVESGKTRVLLGFRARLAYHLNYWCPWLLEYLVKRAYQIKPNPLKATLELTTFAKRSADSTS